MEIAYKGKQPYSFKNLLIFGQSTMINANGWHTSSRVELSPNQDSRSKEAKISLLVIHSISLPPNQLNSKYVCDFFTNKLDVSIDPYFVEISNLKVSAHLVIGREGELIQFVGFNERAWHAGNSCFAGDESCNDFSIGIELVGADSAPYSSIQYQKLASVTQELMARYPLITRDRIVGHSDIAPGRKTDPGPSFDWGRYFSALSF